MSVEIIDTLSQKNNGKFAIVDCNHVKGGFYQVETIEKRDEIPLERRKKGMLCYVDDDCIYQLLEGIENVNWQKYDIELDLSMFALKEEVYNISQIDEKINELNSLIALLDERISAFENGKSAIAGTFLAGELNCGDGVQSQSFLSDDFKNKFGVDE